MDASSADTAKSWLVAFGCRTCAERAVTPSQLAIVVRGPAGTWELRVRVPRIGLPRPGNEHDARGYLHRYAEHHPELDPTAVATVSADFVKSPYAEKNMRRLDRGQLAPAPRRGRFIIDCGRGHRLQTTSASLIHLADGAIAGGTEEATLARGLVRLRAAPLRPMPVFDPLRDATAFT